MAYSARLPKPLTPKDHKPIRTLAEARAYMLALPDALASQSAWQAAAGQLMEAAETGDPVKIGTFARQLEQALFVSYRQDLDAAPTLGRPAHASATPRPPAAAVADGRSKVPQSILRSTAIPG